MSGFVDLETGEMGLESVNEDKNPSGVASEKKSASGETVSGLSGRELDAAVAAQVMGYDEVERVGGMFYYHNEELDRTSETGGRWRSPVPMFSTDIAPAMKVVEKMRECGNQVKIRSFEGAVPWDVTFTDTFGNSDGMSANDLPEAICRAALAAISQ